MRFRRRPRDVAKKTQLSGTYNVLVCVCVCFWFVCVTLYVRRLTLFMTPAMASGSMTEFWRG